MFAHTARIASVSTLSLALIASSISVAQATPTQQNTSLASSQSTSPSLEEMTPDQKPAPVHGEDEQVIRVDGIDSAALPQAEESPSHEPSTSESADSNFSGEPDTELPSEELEGAIDEQSGIESDTLPEEELGSASTSQGSEQDASPTPSETLASPQQIGTPLTIEEQQLAETAVENSEGVLAALTTPMESIEFIAAGITWNSDTSEEITEAALRVREQGEWSEWHDLEVHAVDDEMRAISPRTGTEPLITLEADAVQARVHTRSGVAPEGLEVSLIDPGESATDGQLEPASVESDDIEAIQETSEAASTSHLEYPSPDSNQATNEPMMRSIAAKTPVQTASSKSSADVIKPAIVTRAQWGADESLASNSPQSKELKALYVHHTAGTNNYSKAQAYAQIRSVYRYHAVTLGWPDIGYHFLVDRYGTIYEGRRGSINSLPLGAQAGGFNTNTFGISAMGNFDEASPP